MNWFRKLFTFKVSRQGDVVERVRKGNTWPYADKVMVKVLAPVELMDSFDESYVPVPTGTVLELTRISNAFGLVDPWLVKTAGMHVGGAERCFREWVETGKMEVVSFN